MTFSRKIFIALAILFSVTVTFLISYYVAKTTVTVQKSGISTTDALLKVRALSEVVEYEAALGKTSKKATFTIEDWEGDWGVHVFETVVQEGSSHTATFGWYRVDKRTGEIKKDI